MTHNPKKIINSELELKICIQRSKVQDPELVKKSLFSQCSNLFKKYQLDLLYGQEQLGTDLQILFSKIHVYSEFVQNLLFDFRPCAKLGQILQIVNQSLTKIFQFFRAHVRQKKNYTQQRLKFLQKRLQTQAPDLCNRCNHFILRRNVEETKVLLGVGQFKDPFDFYDTGASDFVNKRNRQQDNQYKLKLANVWENKMKIQQKFHSMEVELDKRKYAYCYSIDEISKIQQVITNIVEQLKINQSPLSNDQSQFTKNLEELINKIYLKLCQHRKNEHSKSFGIQTDQFQHLVAYDNIKKLNDKLVKKNTQIHKKYITKQKQLSQITAKYQKMNQQYNRAKLQKKQLDISLKNLISKNIEVENQLEAANLEIRGFSKKIQDFEKQKQSLRNQIKKREQHFRNKIKATKKSYKKLKQSSKHQIIDPINSVLQEENIENNKTIKNKRVSIRQSIKRSFSDADSNSKQKQNEKDERQLPLHIQKNKKYQLSDIQQKSYLTLKRDDQSDSIIHCNGEDIGSQISINLHQSYRKVKQKSMKNISSKKIKSNLKSLRKIKRKSSQKGESIIQKQQTDSVKLQRNQNVANETNQKFSYQVDTQLEKKKISSNQINKEKVKDQILVANKSQTKMIKQQNNNKLLSMKSSMKQGQTVPINYSQFLKKQSFQSLQFQKKHTKQSKLSKNSSILLNRSTSKYSIQNRGSSNINKKLHNRTFHLYQNQKSVLPLINKLSKFSMYENSFKSQQHSHEQLQAFRVLYRVYVNNLQKLKQSQDFKQNKAQLIELDKNKLIFQQFQQVLYNFICFTLLFSNHLKNNKGGYRKQSNQLELYQSNHSFLKKEQNGKIEECSNGYQSRDTLEYNNQPIQIRKYLSNFNMANLSQSFSSDQYYKIKQKLTTLYFHPQYAHQIQNSHSTLLKLTQSSTINCSLNSSLRNFSQLNSTNKFEANSILNNQILTKNQLNYFKIINVLFAKLHQQNIGMYQIVKKCMIYPYSYLNGSGFVVPGQSILKIKQREQRKTVGAACSDKYQKQTSLQRKSGKISILFGEAIIKFILLHRKCHNLRITQIPIHKKLKANFKSMHTSFNSTNLQDFKGIFTPNQKSQQKQKQKNSQNKNLCKHLIQFQLQLGSQFGFKNILNIKNQINNQKQLQKNNKDEVQKYNIQINYLKKNNQFRKQSYSYSNKQNQNNLYNK